MGEGEAVVREYAADEEDKEGKVNVEEEEEEDREAREEEAGAEAAAVGGVRARPSVRILCMRCL